MGGANTQTQQPNQVGASVKEGTETPYEPQAYDKFYSQKQMPMISK